MNSIYKVIFSVTQGTWVVVSELAKSQGKRGGTRGQIPAVQGGSDTGSDTGPSTGFPGCSQSLLFSILLASGASLLAANPVQAEIHRDASAPAQHQPTLLKSANGTPLVNIQTPNSQGVSHNRYQQFDVEQQGVILNNAREATTTQIGGYVGANPWLAKGEARVILNEVRSQDPSTLNGFIEVAGKQAEVIIANPNGITCSGCGFINAQNTALITGQPRLEGGNLTGFNVTQGKIRIEGQGLNDSGSNHTQLIARAVEVNGAIHAQTLKITTGQNQVDLQGQILGDLQQGELQQGDQQDSTDSDKPAFALDVAQLGGMYAGKIIMVGTEQGVGVRNAGEIGATSGELALSADGTLSNSGIIDAETQVAVAVTGQLDNQGSIYAADSVTLDTEAHLDNQGIIAAGNKVALGADSLRQADDGLLAVGTDDQLALNKQGSLELAVQANAELAGQVIATEDITLNSQQLALDSAEVATKNLTLDTSDNLMANDSLLLAEENMQLKADQQLTLNNTQTQADQTLHISTQGQLDNRNSSTRAAQLQIEAAALENQQGELINLGEDAMQLHVTGDINNNQGMIATNGSGLSLQAEQVNTQQGRIQQAGEGGLNISADSLNAAQGTLRSAGALNISTQAETDIEAGNLQAMEMQINAASINAQNAQLQSSSEGNTQLNATQGINLNNADIRIGAFRAEADTLDLTDGALQAQQDISISTTGTLHNNNASMVAADQIALDVDNIENTHGLISALRGDLSIQSRNNIDNQEGRLESGGLMTLDAKDQVINRQGTILGNSITLEGTGYNLDNNDGLISADNLIINNARLTNVGGLLQGRNLTINSPLSTLDNNNTDTETGLVAHENLTLNVGILFNRTGRLSAGTDLTINADKVYNTDAGLLISGQNISVNTDNGQFDNHTGTAQAGGGLHISSGELNNREGTLYGATGLSLSTAALDNSTGYILNQSGELSIDTGSEALNNNSGQIAGSRVTLDTVDLNNEQGEIAGNNIQVTAQNLNNQQGDILGSSVRISSDSLNNQRGGISGSSINIDTQQLNNNSGELLGSSIGINSSSLDNNYGKISASGINIQTGRLSNLSGAISGDSLALNSGEINNRQGTLYASRSLTIDTNGGKLDNTDTATSGGINSQGTLTLKTGVLVNKQGYIAGKSSSQITAEGVANTAGVIISEAGLALKASSLDNSQGIVQSQSELDLQVDSNLTNTDGQISTEQDLTLKLSGTLDNTNGSLTTEGTLNITSDSLLNDAGLLYAGNNLTLNVTDTLSNANTDQSGGLQVQGELQVSAGSLNNAQGRIQVGGEANLSSDASLINEQGLIQAGGKANLESGELNNQQGQIQIGGEGSLDTAELNNQAGQVQIGGEANLNSAKLNNRQGLIQAGGKASLESGELNNQQGQIEISGTANLTSGDLDNSGGLITSTGSLTLAAQGKAINNTDGALQSGGALAVSSDRLDNTGGLLLGQDSVTLKLTDTLTNGSSDNSQHSEGIHSGGGLSITGGKVKGQGGYMAAAGGILIDNKELDNTQGNIISGAQVSINTGQLTNQQGNISAQNALNVISDSFNNQSGTLVTNQRLKITTQGSFSNTGGRISGDQLTLNTKELTNTSGLLQSATSLSINTHGQKLGNHNGTITSVDQLVIQSGILHNNQGGSVASRNASLSIDTGGQALQNIAGTLSGGTTLTVTSGDLTNNGGLISANDQLTLTVNGALTNKNSGTSGGIASGQQLDITSDSLTSSNGYIAAADKLTITTGDMQNDGGTVVSGQTLNITANQFENQQGILNSHADLNLTTDELDNTGGTISSKQTATLNTGGAQLTNTNGQIAADTLDIQSGILSGAGGLLQAETGLTVNTGGQLLNNSGSGEQGGIISQGIATLTTGTLNNNGGVIASADTLTITGDDLDNSEGQINTQDTLELTISGLTNRRGQIRASQDINLDSSGQTNNDEGLISATDTLNLKTPILSNNQTQADTQGLVAGNLQLHNTQVLSNHQGRIAGTEEVNLNVGQNADNEGGLIWSGGSLSLQSDTGTGLSVHNQGGAIRAENGASIVADTMTGSGSFQSATDLSLTIDSDYELTGDFTFDGDMTVNLNGDFTNYGHLFGLGILNLNIDNVYNHSGAEIKATSLNIQTQSLTNEGLIDGIDNQLTVSGNLNNQNGGRIYGTYLAIEAGSLTNGTPTGSASAIAARTKLLLGAGSLFNYNGSDILSQGDMYIGRNANLQEGVSGQANTIENIDSRINAGGNLTINTSTLRNIDSSYTVETTIVSLTNHTEYTPTQYPEYRFDQGDVEIKGSRKKLYGTGLTNWAGGDYFSDYTTYIFQRQITEEYVSNTSTAQILSGGNMTIYGNITNEQSQILAGGAQTLVGNLVNFTEYLEQTTIDDGTAELSTNESGGRVNHGKTHYYAVSKTAVPEGGKGQVEGNISTGNVGVNGYQAGNVESVDTSNTTPGDVTAANGQQIDNQDPNSAGNPDIQQQNVGTLTGNVAQHQQDVISVLVYNSDINIEVEGRDTRQVNGMAAPISGIFNSGGVTPQGGLHSLEIAPFDSHEVTTQLQNNNAEGIKTVVRTGGQLNLPQSSLYTLNGDLTNKPLLETDPAFTQFSFYNSSEQGNLDNPGHTHRRIGDDLVEQQLIQQQIAQLTGQRYLNGYHNDAEQYQALLAAGRTFAADYNLSPGVALSAEQMANLTSDIVLLVEQHIQLPDGSQQSVMVPQVYALVSEGDLTGNGALLGGHSIQADLDQLTNSGNIVANTDAIIRGNQIDMERGGVQGSNVELYSNNDLNLRSSRVIADNRVRLHADNNLNIETLTRVARNDIGDSQFERINLDGLGYVQIRDPHGELSASAGQDININGAYLINQGQNSTTQLHAGRDINLGTVATRDRELIVWDSRNSKLSDFEQTHSSYLISHNLHLESGRDLNLTGTQVQLSGELTGHAERDINIQHATDTHTTASSYHYRSSGLFSRKQATNRYHDQQESINDSLLSADSINLRSGNDINVTGSTLVAEHDLDLNADNSINIRAAEQHSRHSSYHQKKKSGLMSAGSFGITLGTQQADDDIVRTQTDLVSSTLGSLKGNISLNAGNDIHINASDLLASGQALGVDTENKDTSDTVSNNSAEHTDNNATGNITLRADNITLDSDYATVSLDETHKTKQSGLTLAVTGGVVDTINTIKHSVERISNSSDNRLQALHGYRVSKAAQAMPGQIDNLQHLGDDFADPLNGPGVDENGKEAANSGINLSLSLGSSRSESTRTLRQQTAQGSSLIGEGDITLIALNDDTRNDEETGKHSGNIISRGSYIQGNNINLDAANDIQLRSAENHESDDSTSKSSSAGIGISIGSDGLQLYVEASRSRGLVNQSSDRYLETRLSATNQVKIISGGDTHIEGGQIFADQITGRIGGDLTLISQQDEEHYNNEQDSIGGKIGVGVGPSPVSVSVNASQLDATSEYVAVQEQSGLFAGDSGFDIEVGQHTDLQGGALVSSADPANNRFSTDTLSYNQIDNHAEYDIESVSIGFSTTASGNVNHLAQGFSGGMANDSGSADNTTYAAISEGDIEIRSNPGMSLEQLKTSREEAHQTLERIFDEDMVTQVEESAEFAQMLSQEGPRAVAEYAQDKLDLAGELDRQAAQETDPALRAQLQEQANELRDNWGEGGSHRTALHTVVGGLAGGVTGAVASAGTAAAIPHIDDFLEEQGFSEDARSTILIAASAGIGATTGDVQDALISVGQTANNYLSHQEATERSEAIEDSMNDSEACQNDPECQAAVGEEVDRINQVDLERDLAIEQACEYPNSEACIGKVADLTNIVKSYQESGDSSDGIVTNEYREALAALDRYYSRQINSDSYNVLTGLAHNIGEGIQSSADLAVVAYKAANGDPDAQQQLAQIPGNAIDFLSDPIDNLTAIHTETTAEIARLEAAGQQDAADQLKGGYYGSIILAAVTGGSAATIQGSRALSQIGNIDTPNSVPDTVGGSNGGITGTVWDDISPTQGNYPNSQIPRSFEMETESGVKVWVHGNATEHLAEYARGVAKNYPPNVVHLRSQEQIRSMQAALEQATRGNLQYNEIIRVGGWEFKLSPPRSEGQLPALIHAIPTE